MSWLNKNQDLMDGQFSKFDKQLEGYPEEMVELRQRIKDNTGNFGGLVKGKNGSWKITYADTAKNLKDSKHMDGIGEALNSMKEYLSENDFKFTVQPMTEKNSKALRKYVGDNMAELTGQERWKGQ